MAEMNKNKKRRVRSGSKKKGEWVAASGLIAALHRRFPELSLRLKEAGAVSRWRDAVGAQIAKHAEAVRVKEGVLYVEVRHPIWRSELHHRKRQILARLNQDEGSEVIVDLFLLDGRSNSS